MTDAKATIIAAVITGVLGIVGAAIALVPQIITLQRENSALTEQKDNLQEQNEVLQEEARTDVSALEKRIADLEAKNKTLSDEISKTKTNYETVQANYEAALIEIDEKNATISQQEATIADLRAQLNHEPVLAEAPISIETGSDSDAPSDAVSEHTGKPDLWLSDMDFFDSGGNWNIGGVTKDNAGYEHSHSLDRVIDRYGYSVDGYRIYILDGKYSGITGFFYQDYNDRASDGNTVLSISDYSEEILLWQGTVGRAIDPVAFDVDISNVVKLKIELSGDRSNYTSLGDVGLWVS